MNSSDDEVSARVKASEYLILFFGFVLYSLVAVVARHSASYPLFSIASCLSYAIVLGMLVVYAAFWQISLKRFSLSFAYMCRGSLVVLAMLWSSLLFAEIVTVRKILGACIVIIGIVLFAWRREETQ
jgi:drug/metabolite transporter (DMT)-like permease